MVKSSFIRARIEPELKQQAEEAMNALGITPTQAVRMLYKYVAREHKWPVAMKIPNKQTLKTFKDTDNNIGLTSCQNSADIFEKLKV